MLLCGTKLYKYVACFMAYSQKLRLSFAQNSKVFVHDVIVLLKRSATPLF